MEIAELRTGDRVMTEDGSIAEVLGPSDDGRSVRVRYLECPFDSSLIGTEATRTDYDILAYASGSQLNSASTDAVGHVGRPAGSL